MVIIIFKNIIYVLLNFILLIFFLGSLAGSAALLCRIRGEHGNARRVHSPTANLT